jgi:hypothetical protein
MKDNQMIIIQNKKLAENWSGKWRSSQGSRSEEIVGNELLTSIENDFPCQEERIYIYIPAGLDYQVVLIELVKEEI